MGKEDPILQAVLERQKELEKQNRELRALLRSWKGIYDDGNRELNRRTDQALGDEYY